MLAHDLSVEVEVDRLVQQLPALPHGNSVAELIEAARSVGIRLEVRRTPATPESFRHAIVLKKGGRVGHFLYVRRTLNPAVVEICEAGTVSRRHWNEFLLDESIADNLLVGSLAAGSTTLVWVRVVMGACAAVVGVLVGHLLMRSRLFKIM